MYRKRRRERVYYKTSANKMLIVVVEKNSAGLRGFPQAPQKAIGIAIG